MEALWAVSNQSKIGDIDLLTPKNNEWCLQKKKEKKKNSFMIEPYRINFSPLRDLVFLLMRFHFLPSMSNLKNCKFLL